MKPLETDTRKTKKGVKSCDLRDATPLIITS